MAEAKYVLGSGTVLLAVALIVVLVAGITYVLTSGQQLPQPPGNETTEEIPKISVSGEATRTVRPDILVIGLTIETENATATAAEAANAQATAALKAALLANGIKESEIQTSSYYTYPVYNDSCWCEPWPCRGDVCPMYETAGDGGAEGVAVESYPMPPYPCECSQEIIGYKSTHSIMVKTEDTESGGEVIDAVAGVNNARFDYFYFSLKDETRIGIESELAAEAARAAKSKAEGIATGLGASLGKIVSIQTGYYYPPYYDYGYAKGGGMETVSVGAEESVPAEIFPQELALSSQIYVVYEIKQ
ncbi:SIMPL domain-containing protein [Candidatus Micrarchaeota archaeon]|nr:SIMPL domain-containing protein [Candidatus Micrarchaeota archaeon]